MSKLPVIKGIELVKLLESLGFRITRTKGSHVRLRAEDGRVTTVPVHGNTYVKSAVTLYVPPQGI
jgi:predicted RNA binding protein YcfA (HicA-like mRNA interferase family)